LTLPTYIKPLETFEALLENKKVCFCCFFINFFWCASFGYLYFCDFLGTIDNVIAVALLTSIQYMAPGFKPTIS
jgi:hypothetical protein